MTLNDDQVAQLLNEGITCIGCGAQFQSEKAGVPGYLNQSKLHNYLASLNSIDDPIELLCERCFKLKNYNQIEPVAFDSAHFQQILSSIATKKALVLYIVDLFDVAGSMIDGLSRFIGQNPVVLIGNKLDVLPKSVKKNKLANWLRKQAKDQGVKAVKSVILSADKGDAGQILLDEIADYVDDYPEIFVVGVTNVGKSTLINQIIKQVSGNGSVITTSRFPGTTLDKIEIPLTETSKIIDTPGIIHASQMTHFVDSKDFKYLLPNKEVKARTFQLISGQSIFLGGLGWIDFLNKQKISFTAYFDNKLDLHRTKSEKAAVFFKTQAGKIMQPVVLPGNEEMQSKEIKLSAGQDLAISGLGWFTFHDPVVICFHFQKGLAISVRQAEI
ncbi:ribosome biogenesis GTPase YqeH [Oenococcus sicerae]|uniref:Ribosome biogenesis GTPase YqeH n=1 Tax=Oenococcus sicerae TaxID=2203724 RepID=A0AAJ1RBA5_9LACO|nr:ribosome biogenesis GTPase YqeH [Oenococcus sicerae]MDN6899637.1 ribosome biogenesis GTPase YqeH [Oenococcus sicerae]QAS70325.1 ribosome biogenesis GTPase YqeH [Oenococcus sicerae]